MKTDATVDLARLRATFASGKTRDLAWREQQLDVLLDLLDTEQPALLAALAEDLGKPAVEGWGADIIATQGEVAVARAELRSWAAARPAEVTPQWQPAEAYVMPQPVGLVLVISPWNYPVQLLVEPIAAAIAAGNCVVAKPSELSPATSGLLSKLLSERLDPDAFLLVEGAVDETTALLAAEWDHIFYTGSTRVGRVVAKAAAENLTPTTLELGGKCPTYIDASANIAEAAKRIAWAKFMNVGQTCLAPDYLLVHSAVHDEVIAAITEAITTFFGEDPSTSTSLGRIVNTNHFDRLVALRDGEGAGDIVIGGGADREQRYIAPTVLDGTDPDSAIMGEEIFGPLLPVITVAGSDEAIAFVNARPRALAAYVFAEDRGIVDQYIEQTISGGACVNAALLHTMVPDLPFGGIGPSGMGAYHGRHGFDRLSHLKSVLHRPTDAALDHLMPPYPSMGA